MQKMKVRFGRLAVVWLLATLSGVVAAKMFPTHGTLALVVTCLAIYTTGYRYCFSPVDSSADPPS